MSCTVISELNLTFGIVMKTVIVPAVHLEVVDLAVLPWCPPWAAEEAVPPNTGQMEACKMLP